MKKLVMYGWYTIEATKWKADLMTSSAREQLRDILVVNKAEDHAELVETHLGKSQKYLLIS